MDFEASQSAFADAVLHADRPMPENVTSARGEADARRFAVYRNNVYVGLVGALAKRFPATERLVGQEFFRGMARAFAQVRKPSSPLLFRYGDEFPDFIASFGPAKSLPYLADLARLEAAWTEAYHAADAAPLGVGALAAIPPENLPSARLHPHPAARLVRSLFPVGSIWFAHQAEEVRPLAAKAAEAVLVVRPALAVSLHVLPPQDSVFAAALLAGESLGAAADRAFAAADFDFGTALVGLVSLGAFEAVLTDAGERLT